MSRRRSVDLPQPDGPSRAVVRPAGKVSEMRSMATPGPKRLVTSASSSSMSGALVVVGVLGLVAPALERPVERAAVDAELLGGLLLVAGALGEHELDVAALELR